MFSGSVLDDDDLEKSDHKTRRSIRAELEFTIDSYSHIYQNFCENFIQAKEIFYELWIRNSVEW